MAAVWSTKAATGAARVPVWVPHKQPESWLDDDGADLRDFAVVPDVVELTTCEALRAAHGQGFDVIGPGPDGVPVTAVTAGMTARVTG